MSTVEPAARPHDLDRAVTLVDSDVHPYFRHGMSDLAPYLTRAWQKRLGIEPDGRQSAFINGGQIGFPKNEFYLITSGATRLDSVPPDGGPAGSDPAFLCEQHLDKYGIDRALLVGGPNSGLAAFPDPDAAAALAGACNDWLIEHWLEADPRFRGTIVVAPQDPALAVAEIERLADRRDIAAVHMSNYNIPLGERHYYPIYEAAQYHGLPVVVHPSATEAIYVKAPQLAYVPTYYAEFHALLGQTAQSNLVSLLVQGVFERFPRLKVVFIEFGFGWAMDLLWRLDRDWKAQRDEIPWVKRLPSDYARTNIRFTTQPFYEPKRPEHLHAVLEAIDAEHTLMFSSDYPHWDFDDPKRALKDLPHDVRESVFARTALETYGERLL